MNSTPQTAVCTFDTAVYRLSAIKKAAYRLSGRCIVNIELPDPRSAHVTLQCHDASADLPKILVDFHREVTDQELREVVADETAAVRSLLLAQAFSQTSLIAPELEDADYLAEPKGISASDAFPPRQIHQ